MVGREIMENLDGGQLCEKLRRQIEALKTTKKQILTIVSGVGSELVIERPFSMLDYRIRECFPTMKLVSQPNQRRRLPLDELHSLLGQLQTSSHIPFGSWPACEHRSIFWPALLGGPCNRSLFPFFVGGGPTECQ